MSIAATTGPKTDETKAFFARAGFAAQPARACHGLVRRLPVGVDGARVKESLALAHAADDALASVQLWVETVAAEASSDIARQRMLRELGRAANGTSVTARAVVLAYANGVHDLVVVAHRGAVDRPQLVALTELLATGVQPSAPVVSAAASAQGGPQIARLGWGLGEVRDTGRLGSAEAEAPSGASAEEIVAAVALVLARYEGAEQARFAVATVDDDGVERLRIVSLTVTDTTAVADLVGSARAALAAGSPPLDDVPGVAVVFDTSTCMHRYVSCLAPAFPLTVTAQTGPDGQLLVDGRYDEGVVAPAVGASLVQHVATVARALRDGVASTAAGDVELVGADEARAILAAGCSPSPVGYQATTMHRVIADIAAAQPDAPAVSDDATTLTYAELDARAERIADGLAALGVAAGDRVGVCLDRDVDLVASLLGVLKAGAAYVPMDPRYPADRLAFTTRDAQVRVVVTTVGSFPAVDDVRLVEPADLLAPAAARAEVSVDATDPAYVIYTSGSTGQPKGVVVPHANVTALLAATAVDMRLTADDVWSFFHSSSFDFSVWEIWGCLLSGGHLLVVPYWVSRSPEEFFDLLLKRRVTVVAQTPSAFAGLKDVALRRAEDLAVRLIVFGGEQLDVRAVDTWFRRYPHTRCRLVNMFGITETTVHVTSRTVTPGDVAIGSLSVGRALPGWSVSVRDRAGRVQPFGAAGEIYVGGAGVASHYLNRDELTSQRFIKDPYTGERVYRSGDGGLMRTDGSLDYLGRLDDQVKVRGYRIELGEIRSVLLDDPSVSAAVVVLNNGDGADAATVRLDAYVVLAPEANLDEVRHRAAKFLPEHMVPATFTALSSLPLTVNGKVDLSKLAPAEPASTCTTAGSELEVEDAAGGELGAIVLRAWREVLGADAAGDADFFDLGGNSLLAVRLSGALRRSGVAPVPLRELYLHPTVAELTDFITRRERGEG